MTADRQFLFGLLALQTGLIQQTQLVTAFHAWTCDKSRSLADHLIGLGHLNAAQRAAVEALAALHVEAHGGDVERSLAAVPAGRSTRERLAALGDPDIGATLSQIGSGHRSTEDDEADADRTPSYAVGTTTSEGQRFRVLRPHARGGLGAVFVALDGELNREVALKQILDRHADDPTSRARFLLEAEITGGLEHPGIVPVYGLGTYGDGRPYYAMRFIRGDSLKEAVDRFHAAPELKADPGRRSLELRKLLSRFTDVCNAIDYAHSRGVLHRDIKPGNIIVGKHGETLVVDWGLAKALGRIEPGTDSGERTLVPSSASGSAETLPGSALGTPSYMSPEQAEGDIEHLGPRSDVYSLGATLYHLLTGRPPAEGEIGVVLRAVQRGEFPPPRQLDATIDKALEAVCLKAMAHKPADRYASPRALAEDVERWMADEPVSAWREPWGRRARRWARRHRTAVTAALAAMLVALVGTAAVLAVQTRANASLHKANAELATANQKVTRANADLKSANERERQRFELAMQAIKLFHGEVTQDLLLKEKQFAGLRSRLLNGAAEFYGKLERLLDGQADPVSRSALGRAYFELAELTGEIGKKDEAVAVHRKGLAVRRELASRPGADAETVLDVVRSLLRFGGALFSADDTAGMMASHEEALGLAEGLVGSGTGPDEARFVLADCLRLKSYPVAERNSENGLAMARRALAIERDLAAKDPSVARYLEGLAECYYAVGFILKVHMGRAAEALAAEEEAAEIYRKLADSQPEAYRLQNMLARLYNNMSNSLWRLGRLDDAIASLHRAVAIWQHAADANPAATILANNLAYGLDNLADDLIAVGRPAEALEAMSRSRPILRSLADADPGNVSPPVNLAFDYTNTGRALARMGMWSEAKEAFARAMAIEQKRVDEHPSDDEDRRRLADILSVFGWSLRTAGRSAEAVSAFGRERAIRQRIAAGPDKDKATDRDRLANCETNTAAALVALRRLSEARACCDRAIAIRGDLVKGDPQNPEYLRGLAEGLLRSGSVRSAAGDPAGAAAEWRRAAALYASHPPNEQSAVFRACCHGSLAGLAGVEGSGITAAEASAQAEAAMAILRGALGGAYRDVDLLRVEPGLGSLRPRDDFRQLMMDQAFPAEAFAWRVDQDFRPVPAPPSQPW